MKIHSSIKKQLGYPPRIADKVIVKNWKERISGLCKPCWELKYCPFGPLVEDFPLFPPTKKEAKEHNEYLKECLKTKKLGNEKKLDKAREKWFKEETKNFNLRNYPDSIPKVFLDASCKVFGHICPASR